MTIFEISSGVKWHAKHLLIANWIFQIQVATSQIIKYNYNIYIWIETKLMTLREFKSGFQR